MYDRWAGSEGRQCIFFSLPYAVQRLSAPGGDMVHTMPLPLISYLPTTGVETTNKMSPVKGYSKHICILYVILLASVYCGWFLEEEQASM